MMTMARPHQCMPSQVPSCCQSLREHVLPTGNDGRSTGQEQSWVKYKQDVPGECVCVMVSVSVCTERGGVGSLRVHQKR